ncbi:WD repeat protein [Aspergillus alliaceus]|uniref:WD repeat protein n=1 Tax=Petromyces alliaceus TaxID=209559 RepID=UPI0012A53F31|nr:WD repeat protein [Aspergillus alliaceus]KAB8239516.1 WD repeat protein [Aspergillus alliaceus]
MDYSHRDAVDACFKTLMRINPTSLSKVFATLGSISPHTFHVAQTTQLIHHLEPVPGIRFSSRQDARQSNNPVDVHLNSDGELYAHRAGVNVLAIDHYDGRFLVSGGADPSIHLWDLESRGSELGHVHTSVASVTKLSHEDAHTHAITSVSIYPFDPAPSTILTTSRDCTLKLSALEPAAITPVHTFNLDCTPYSHSLSPHPASPLLIAVGTAEKPVRLLDLRSGLSTHGLPGHSSSVLSVSWAPHRPHILASASEDNRVILFDIRRGGHNSAIATLDMDDAVGLVPPRSAPPNYQSRPAFSPHARAHNGAVTGVRWTSTGSHLVTAGQDARIRVWDASTGANTLVHFGPRVRNAVSSHLAERVPLLLPKGVMGPGQETLLWPNFNDTDDRGEIFMFELREGTFVKRLKVPGLMVGQQGVLGRPTALSAARVNSLVWRGNGASGEGMEMFSAHGDGTIRAWVSREPEGEPDESEEAEQADRKRKRDVLEEIYKGFMQ